MYGNIYLEKGLYMNTYLEKGVYMNIHLEKGVYINNGYITRRERFVHEYITGERFLHEYIPGERFVVQPLSKEMLSRSRGRTKKIRNQIFLTI